MPNLKKNFLLITPPVICIIWLTFFIANLIRITLNYDPKDREDFINKFSYEIYDSQNKIISKLSHKFDIKDNEDKIPNLVKNAFISAEDKRFFNHIGIDIIGSSRAFIKNIQSGYIREGGSTITQQLSRQIFLNNDISFKRKIKEGVISIIIDLKYSKKQILKMYLNNIYLGEGANGINEASYIYFGKLINELTLSEIAMLAGLAPAPNFYSPYKNYDLAIKQRNKILKSMYLDGHIRKKIYETALKEKIVLFNKEDNEDHLLTKYILNESKKKISTQTKDITNNHLIIKSSIKKDWQVRAQKLSKNLLPDEIQIGLISIESDTGLIRTMVSGRDKEFNQFNRVTSAIRPLSSTFKIIPYCLAFLEGKNIYDTYNDSPTCWNDYCPKNFSNIYQGDISLIDAFKKSSNIVPIKISREFGLEKIIKLANVFGLGYLQNFEPYLPLAIGAYGDSIINITNAYSAINNKGNIIKPSILEKIEFKNGELIWKHKIISKKIIDEKIANNLNLILEKSVSDGNGSAAAIKGKKIFGKTGTSDLNRDLWFIGSIKNITTGIWIGYDNNSSSNLSSGSAANFWKIYINGINI